MKTSEQLLEKTEELLGKIEVREQSWEKDVKDIKAHMQDEKAHGVEPDYEKMEEHFQKILDKQSAEQVASRMLTPGQQEQLKLPDPWSTSASILQLGDFDPETLVHKGLPGLNTLIQVPTMDDNHKALARLSVDVKILDSIGRLVYLKAGTPYPGFKEVFPKTSTVWKTFLRRYVDFYAGKAAGDLLDTTDTANWVPTGWSSEIRELIMLELKVAAIFERFTMPQSPFDFPIDLTDQVGDYLPETTSIPSAPWSTTLVQTLTDAKTTFSAKKLRARILMSAELVENAAIAMLPFTKKKLFKMLASTQEKTIINGQASGAIDLEVGGGAIAANDCRKAMDGLRYFCLKTTDGAASDPSTVDFGNAFTEVLVIKSMRAHSGFEEYSTDPEALVYLMPAICVLKMLADSTNFPSVMTKDKYGEEATVVKGEIARIGGVSILPTRYMPTDLNASGVYDDVTKTMTGVLLVRKDGWLIGDYGDIRIEAEKNIEYDFHHLVAFQQMHLKYMFGWTKKMAVYGYEVPNA